MISITFFANISNKMSWKFQNFDDIFFAGKAQNVFKVFVSKRFLNEDIKTYLGFLPNKSNNHILGMDLLLLRISVPYIFISLANVMNKSLKSGVFE